MSENGATQPTSIDELKPKMQLHGKVSSVQLWGAFVDVGVGKDGRLHISQLSSEHVKNVTDVLNEGDEVVVWVRKVAPEQGLIDLTMVKPPDVTWNEVSVDQIYTGKVVRVERYGAFVDIGAERPGLVRIKELSDDYVDSTSDVVEVGDEVEVKIINIDPRKRQIDLTMRNAALAEAALEDEEETSMPTAMEIALRAAMEASNSSDAARNRRRNNKKKMRAEQEDILSRTLNRHRE